MDLAEKYIEMFGCLPIVACRSMSDEQLLAAMQKAIDTGEPIEIVYKDGEEY